MSNTLSCTDLTISAAKTYTPTISSLTGCTLVSTSGYWLSIGGVEVAYGTVRVQWASGSSTNGGITECSFSVSLPSGLFSSIHSFQATVTGTTTWGIQWSSAGVISTTSMPITVYTNNSGLANVSQVTVSFFAIGI